MKSYMNLGKCLHFDLNHLLCFLIRDLSQIEADREEKYFLGLEKRETLEQKMLATTKIKIKVVTCKVVRVENSSVDET